MCVWHRCEQILCYVYVYKCVACVLLVVCRTWVCVVHVCGVSMDTFCVVCVVHICMCAPL